MKGGKKPIRRHNHHKVDEETETPCVFPLTVNPWPLVKCKRLFEALSFPANKQNISKLFHTRGED